MNRQELLVAPSVRSILGVATLLFCGCGGSPEASVTGTVVVDGELASGGTVTLHPVSGGAVATGRIHSDGSFVVKTGQGDRGDPDQSTIDPGDYVATVVVNAPPRAASEESAGPPDPGGRLTAAKYADKKTSGLRFTIEPGRQVLSLVLERAVIEAEAEPDDNEASAPGTDELDGESTPADGTPEEGTTEEQTDE